MAITVSQTKYPTPRSSIVRVLIIFALLVVSPLACFNIVQAQTPTATPYTPAQDPTRPPGTTLPPSVPPQTQNPQTQDPTAPPGTQRTETVRPTTPATTAPVTRPSQPVTNTPQSPTRDPSQTSPTPQQPIDPNVTQPTDPNATPQDIPVPRFPDAQARPLPPMPNLQRLGIRPDQTLALTLDEAIRRALDNNNDIEVARRDVSFNETVLQSLLGAYVPIFAITPQLTNTVEPVVSTLAGANTAGTLTSTDFSFSPSVDKRFERGGGSYRFFFNNVRRTTSSTFNQLNPFYSSSLGVQFTQPLLRDRSIDVTRREIRVQRKRLEQSDADFRLRVTNVIAQVQRAYWDLTFALRDQQNLLQGLNLSRENFRRTEARVAAGAAAPIERAEVQTELSNRETELLSASQRVSLAENNLKILFLRDELQPEWFSQIVPTDQPTFDETPVILQDALTEARANRPELRRLRLQSEINDVDQQFYRNQTRPRVDITSTVSTTGLAGSPRLGGSSIAPGTQIPLIGDGTLANSNADAFLLQQINVLRTNQGLPPLTVPLITAPATVTVAPGLVGGYARTLRNLFGFDTRNIVVGVRIEIPFRNTVAEANLAGSRIQRTQLEAQQRAQFQAIEVEVRNAAQSVETARQRVLSARSLRQNAEVQLEGERRLFQVGRSTTFLLFQRENQLTNSRALELRAETDYNIALSELQRATSTTLRANNVLIESFNQPNDH